MSIGFCPFTQNTLFHKKVRHVPGKKGDDNRKMTTESAKAKYKEIKVSTKEGSINSVVFTSCLPVHTHLPTLSNEYEQVKALVEDKSVFSEGSQWCTMGVQLLGSNVVFRTQ